jgi:hypothetical protein
MSEQLPQEFTLEWLVKDHYKLGKLRPGELEKIIQHHRKHSAMLISRAKTYEQYRSARGMSWEQFRYILWDGIRCWNRPTAGPTA